MRRFLFSTVLIVLALHLFFRLPFLGNYENVVFDLKTRLAGRTVATSIVLVEIDQSSIDFYHQNFDLPFPWPRSLYGRAVDFLSRCGSRAIALDMIFSEPDPFEGEDIKLAEAMRRAGNVFLPLFFNRAAGAAVALPPFEVQLPAGLQPPRRQGVLTSVPRLLAAQRGGGNSQSAPDRDGIFRRLTHFIAYGGKTYPSFPLAIALFLRPDLDPARIPFNGDGSLLIRFYRSDSFPRYRLADVIQSEVRLAEGKSPIILPAVFKDKVVIIGATAPGLLDLRPSPLAPVTSAFELQANSLLNFLRQDFLRQPGEAWQWLAVLLLVALLNLALLGSRSYLLQALLSLAAVGLALALNIVLFFAGLNLVLLPQLAAVALTSATDITTCYHRLHREKKFIQAAFQNYLSDSLLKQVLKNPAGLALGGEKKIITVFFSDLAGFSSLTESMDAEEVVGILNAYLERMTNVILAHEGFVNKFEGDAVMALWGAPLAIGDQAGKAMRAALECQQQLADLNQEFLARGRPALQMRIGINSGEMIVGNIGSRRRFEYTVIGDPVNLASRLEGLNKQYGTRVICGAATRELDGGTMALRRLDRVRVKGKQRPEEIFEVVAERENLGDRMRECMSRFEEALDLYFAGSFQRAADLFAWITGDPPAAVFLQRCRFLLAHPPPQWDGVWTYTEK